MYCLSNMSTQQHYFKKLIALLINLNLISLISSEIEEIPKYKASSSQLIDLYSADYIDQYSECDSLLEENDFLKQELIRVHHDGFNITYNELFDLKQEKQKLSVQVVNLSNEISENKYLVDNIKSKEKEWKEDVNESLDKAEKLEVQVKKMKSYIRKMKSKNKSLIKSMRSRMIEKTNKISELSHRNKELDSQYRGKIKHLEYSKDYWQKAYNDLADKRGLSGTSDGEQTSRKKLKSRSKAKSKSKTSSSKSKTKMSKSPYQKKSTKRRRPLKKTTKSQRKRKRSRKSRRKTKN